MKMKMIADPPIWIIDDNSGKIWCFSMPEPNSDGKVTFQIPTKKCHYEFEFSSFFSGCFLETWKRYGIVPSSNVESLQIWCSQDSESGSLLGLGTCSAACCSQMKRLCSLCCSSNLQKNAGPRLTQRIPSARSGNTWLKILEIWCNLIACLEHLHFFGEKNAQFSHGFPFLWTLCLHCWLYPQFDPPQLHHHDSGKINPGSKSRWRIPSFAQPKLQCFFGCNHLLIQL